MRYTNSPAKVRTFSDIRKKNATKYELFLTYAKKMLRKLIF